MVKAPSNDRSLAQRGPFTRANGELDRVAKMLRLFRRLAVAIATLLVCAGIAGPPRGLLAATIDVVAAPDSANAEHRDASHHWHDGSSRPVEDLEAVEADVDDNDDDDWRWDARDEVSVAFRWLPPEHQPDRSWRGELQIDASRFAAGTGLPRGPPSEHVTA